MKNTFFLVTIFLYSSLSFSQSRIFLSPQKVAELKAEITIPNSHANELFNSIKLRVDADNLSLYGTDYSSNNYPRSFQAVECALLYKLTDSSKYATKAYQILEDMYTSGEDGSPTIPNLGTWPPSASAGSKALTYAFPGMAYALCYDWARDAWDTQQKSYVYDSIIAGLYDWEHLFRWELYNMPASNWNSVCRGTELMMMLATSQETILTTRYNEVLNILNTHYELAYGKSGYSQEGIGYIHYGCPFSLAAVAAANEISNLSLADSISSKNFHKLLMYSTAFNSGRNHVMTSVDGSGFHGEGLFALAFYYIKTNSELEAYKYYYDRLLGINSGLPINDKYDQARLGAVWNLIFYPYSESSGNPNLIMGNNNYDHKFGAYFSRNRWKNENDILFNYMGKYLRHDENGWMVAETFNWSLFAFNTMFAGQSAKEYDHTKITGLLVDDFAWNPSLSKPHRDKGSSVYFENRDDGFYAISDGDEKYFNLGVDNAIRHCDLKYINDSFAIISFLDKISSSTSHVFKWQINVGNETNNGGVTSSVNTENGVPYFLLQGANNSYLKGWAITPLNSFSNGDPLFLETTNTSSTDIWIVMQLGTGTPPVINKTGSDLSSIALLNSYSVSYSSTEDRILIEDITTEINYTENDIRIYPNPAQNYIFIEGDISGKVSIVDSKGEVLLTSNNINSAIDISHLPAGIYFLRINGISKKIIKLK